MPFLTQRDLATNLRSKAEKDYKAQLRAALSAPGLSAEQRRDIQFRLSQVGQPKVYDANSTPLPGAIQLPKTPVPLGLDPALLQDMKKADLQTLAEQHGFPTTGTRAVLIQRLLTGSEKEK